MSHIKDFTPFKFNEDQQIAAGQMEEFISQEVDRVFILKGHAGTGKTFIIQALIRYLKDQNIPVVLLASTGRAAKVVSEKALFSASTVHKHIYELDVEKNDDENKVRRLVFKLKRNLSKPETIYIVDEVSMISDRNTAGVYVDFGSGKLLTDFFFFIGSRKVIFSGDPCQLPPINSLFSPCLNMDYLVQQHHKTVKSAKLAIVMRQGGESGISVNANVLRNHIERKHFPYANINVSRYSDLHVHPNLDQMVESYVKNIYQKGLESTIFLTYTNAMASEINAMTRELLFPGKMQLVEKESLLVVQNNYKYDLANGEHLRVTRVFRETESKAGLTFRKIEVQVKDAEGAKLTNAYIIEELLYAKESNLTSEQEYHLYRDFIIRIKKKGITPKSENFLNELITDPFLNALRVKFGYAITCHKAQGGEWLDAYIILEKSLFNPTARENQFRWMYTAISRGIKSVHFLQNIAIK